MRLFFLILATVSKAWGWIFKKGLQPSFLSFLNNLPLAGTVFSLKEVCLLNTCFQCIVPGGDFHWDGSLTSACSWVNSGAGLSSPHPSRVWCSFTYMVLSRSHCMSVCVYPCTRVHIHGVCIFFRYWNRGCAFYEPLARKCLGTNQLNRLVLCCHQQVPMCPSLLHRPHNCCQEVGEIETSFLWSQCLWILKGVFSWPSAIQAGMCGSAFIRIPSQI